MMNKLKSFIGEKKFIARVTDGWSYSKSDEAVWVKDILNFLKTHKEEKNEWIKIDKKHPLPKFEEVLAYNKKWINEDFNPKGIRIGYLADEGNFVSAVYDSDSEGYGTCFEEGDDYDCCQLQPDGTTKTWYHRNGEAIEGYIPNMPTHYMKITTLAG